MKKPWFGVHRFWGWYPQTWQGYSVIALMFFAVSYSFIFFYVGSVSLAGALISAFPLIILLVSATILIVERNGAKPAFGETKADNFSPDNPKAYLFLPALMTIIMIYYLVNKAFLNSFLLLLTSLLLLQLYRDLIKKKFLKGSS